MTSGTSKLLFDDHPLVISPKLAAVLDSSDLAVVLQQVHYWIGLTDNVHYGHKWVYNSINQWAEQFPFSERSTRRHFRKLKKMGVLIAKHLGSPATNRTLWYRIDHDRLEELERQFTESENASGQIGRMQAAKLATSKRPDWPDVKKELNIDYDQRLQTENNPLNAHRKNGDGVEVLPSNFKTSDVPEDLRPYHQKLALWAGHLRVPKTQVQFNQWTHGLRELKEICEAYGLGPEVLDHAHENSTWYEVTLTDGHSLRVFAHGAAAEMRKEAQSE